MMSAQPTDEAAETVAMDVVIDALAELSDEQVRARVLKWVTDELASDRNAAARYVAAARASPPHARPDTGCTPASRHHEFAEEFQRFAAGRTVRGRARSAGVGASLVAAGSRRALLDCHGGRRHCAHH